MINILYIIIPFLIAIFIALLILILSYLFGINKPNFEKNSAYECGFLPFSNARLPFEIHFYVVSILFLIFDVEIMFLLPWAININKFGFYGFFITCLFIIILIIGFIYEWKKGALEWYLEIEK